MVAMRGAPSSPDVAALAGAELEWSSSCLNGLRDLQETSFDALRRDLHHIEAVENAKPEVLPETTLEALAGHYGLQLDVATLPDPAAAARLASLTDMEAAFDGLKKTTNEDRVRIFRSYIETLRHKTREMGKQVAHTQLDAARYTAAATPSIAMLRDFMNEKRHHAETAKVEQDIAKGLRRVEALTKETEAEEARWMRLPDDEAPPEAAAVTGASAALGFVNRNALPSQQPHNTQVQRYRWLTNQHDDIFDANSKVLKMFRAKARLLNALRASNAAYKERSDAVRAAADAEIEALIEETTSTAGTCAHDLDAIAAGVEASHATDRAMADEFEAFRNANDQALADNEDAFEAVWAKLFEFEAELRDLGSQRSRLVKQRVARVVAERRREQELERVLQSAERHRALLENHRHNCDVALGLLQFVRDTVVQGADKGVSAQRKNTHDQLSDLIVDVQRKELDLFRALHRKIGDLIQRNDLFCDRLSKGMEGSWQIKALYKTTHAELVADIDQLRSMQRQMSKDFEPTEAALHEAGVAFVHPSAEDESEAMKTARAAFAAAEKRRREDYEVRRLEHALELETRSTVRPPPEAVKEALQAVLTDAHPTDIQSAGTTAVLAPTDPSYPDPQAVVAQELSDVVLAGPLISSAAAAARAKLEAHRAADAAAGVDEGAAAAAAAAAPHPPHPPAHPRGKPRKFS